jgi:hypothetical protein
MSPYIGASITSDSSFVTGFDLLIEVLTLHDRLAFVRRSTWKFTQSNPTFSSRGLISRFQRLLGLSGVTPGWDGKGMCPRFGDEGKSSIAERHL